jgi:hypothetical protein
MIKSQIHIPNKVIEKVMDSLVLSNKLVSNFLSKNREAKNWKSFLQIQGHFLFQSEKFFFFEYLASEWVNTFLLKTC